MDIISQMQPMDWVLVVIVLGLTALTIWVAWLFYDMVIKEAIETSRKRKAEQRKRAEQAEQD